MARRDTRGGRLFFADRFPLIAKAIEALPVRSCIDGEAIVVDSRGLSAARLRMGAPGIMTPLKLLDFLDRL